MTIPTAPFGDKDMQVTRVGLGGEGVLRTHGRSDEAQAVIEAALQMGISYYDSAPAYAGSQGYYGQVWTRRPDARDRMFQTSKSASRDKAGALADLRHSLSTMGLDRLDLWQIHDLRTEAEFQAIEAPGGALEAFVQARDQGLVKHIGVTGHHDPYLLTKAVLSWPLDAVLLPVNPAEAALPGFMDETLPMAREKGLAIIGMKLLGGGHYLGPREGVEAESLIRFALAQPVTTVVVGCSSPAEVGALARAAAQGPLPPEEAERLTDLFRPQSRHLAFYRGRP
ncbi:MAG: aldo/keto reductase [Desulfarculaceae bacterium]|nr:aldo/keto reductase [Desulfarculaceae bacterium]MCF8072869.1 aldo/keto reductase [Desulfarculaceae bacterium]MCF8101037.1 aldo/keto reductase [Desulfarculaceae bacterium]MCF8115576.1 aldo/keto reductase [Desulfarculaceae bacterium]